jgi:hypothetical protein
LQVSKPGVSDAIPLRQEVLAFVKNKNGCF